MSTWPLDPRAIVPALALLLSGCQCGPAGGGGFEPPPIEVPAALAPECAPRWLGLARAPPSVLLVLDRSYSMATGVNGVSKWTIAKQAVRQVTQQHEARIRFGLMMFPLGDMEHSTACMPGELSVDVTEGSAEAIRLAMDQTAPGGKTPIGAALAAAAEVDALRVPGRAGYAMLITDGMETCRGDGPAVASASLASGGVKTFVVGFGQEVDPGQLALLAEAGGTASAGAGAYFQADDALGLTLALREIARAVDACELAVSPAPADPARLEVFVGGSQTPRGADGWEYDARSQRLTLHGAACRAASADPPAQVAASDGCFD